MATEKPLPLKQRTSSADCRRDYNSETWWSVVGLLKVREFLITVDHFSIWRRHLAWAIENGRDLRDHMTQRYASSMIFMSLLLGVELNVLFNSAGVTTEVRQALLQEQFRSVSFWAGFCIIISAILTLLSLISIFTAWTMVSSVSEANAHCIFRSSIGQYVAELPGRFIVGSIYSFLIWICLFFFLLLPMGFWSFLLLIIVLGLFVHTIAAFSAFGRIIMHSGAMGSARIFEKDYESSLFPHTLHTNLLFKARANLKSNVSIMRQYRSKNRNFPDSPSDDEFPPYYSDSSDQFEIDANGRTRKRTESLVKFADGYDTTGKRFELPSDYSLPDDGEAYRDSLESSMPDYGAFEEDHSTSAFHGLSEGSRPPAYGSITPPLSKSKPAYSGDLQLTGSAETPPQSNFGNKRESPTEGKRPKEETRPQSNFGTRRESPTEGKRSKEETTDITKKWLTLTSTDLPEVTTEKIKKIAQTKLPKVDDKNLSEMGKPARLRRSPPPPPLDDDDVLLLNTATTPTANNTATGRSKKIENFLPDVEEDQDKPPANQARAKNDVKSQTRQLKPQGQGSTQGKSMKAKEPESEGSDYSPTPPDKDVWYNGIYFGDDDDDEVLAEKTSLLLQDQMERGKFLSAIPETKTNEQCSESSEHQQSLSSID